MNSPYRVPIALIMGDSDTLHAKIVQKMRLSNKSNIRTSTLSNYLSTGNPYIIKRDILADNDLGELAVHSHNNMRKNR